MTGPTVTIGILTRDAASYIDRTIPALLSWSRPEYEIIVVDSGSTDGTVDRLRRYPGVRIAACRDNLGYGRGKNALVRMARGRYLLLLDDDILVADGGVVEECLAFFEQHRDAAFVSVPLLDADRARTPHYGLFFATRKIDRSLQELTSRRFFEVGGFVGGLIFCEKSTFLRLGGFDTIYPCQDYDLCARAYLLGWRIYTVTTAHAIHLGVDRRSQVDRWTTWYEFQLCGFLRTIVKNYTSAGVVVWLPLASLWILWKAVRKFLETGNPRVLSSYTRSLVRFFKDLPNTLGERARMQSRRVVADDRFRRIDYAGARYRSERAAAAPGVMLRRDQADANRQM